MPELLLKAAADLRQDLVALVRWPTRVVRHLLKFWHGELRPRAGSWCRHHGTSSLNSPATPDGA